MSLRLVPLTRTRANSLVTQWHRHHKPVVGYRYAIGATRRGELVGAIIAGRPVSRELDAERIIEVTRCVTDGHKNVASFLYSAAARVAEEMGFEMIQTYILAHEPGTSLRAAGWRFDGVTDEAHRWTNRSGRRSDQPVEPKQRWIRILYWGRR